MKRYESKEKEILAVEVTPAYITGLPRMGKQIVGFGETAEIHHKNRKAKTYAQVNDFIIQVSPDEYCVMSAHAFNALFKAVAEEVAAPEIDTGAGKFAELVADALSGIPGEDGPAEDSQLPDADEVKARREEWEAKKAAEKVKAEEEKALEAAKGQAEEKRLAEEKAEKEKKSAENKEKGIKL